MIERQIAKAIKSSHKSIFLLGPRQVGKSTLIKSLKPDLTVNFADEKNLFDHSTKLDLLSDTIERRKPKTIFLDEIQRIPQLLNTVQSLIDENKKLKFYISGSSARKLKRGGANLLPGRTFNFFLGPLTFKELNYDVEIRSALKYGFLPEVYTTESLANKKLLLNSYVANYLKEEIRAEALVRSFDSFSRFLAELSNVNGKFVDYSKLSKKTKISRHSIPNYFEILEDTLIGQRLFPHPELVEKMDLVKHPKFYFFDGGVFNGLCSSFDISDQRIGVLAEQLVYSQLTHSFANKGLNQKLHTLRTRGGLEVDFVFELANQFYAIEVKASDNITDSEVAGLTGFKKYLPKCKSFIFHCGTKELKVSGVWALPVAAGLKELGL